MVVLPSSNAKERLVLQDYKVSKDGKARYIIGVEDGRIGIIFIDEAAWGAQTIPERIDQVLEALLEENSYGYGAIARGARGFGITRTFEDPAQANVYIADLKEKALDVDSEIIVRNACMDRKPAFSVACAGYTKIEPPTEEEIQQAIQALKDLSD